MTEPSPGASVETPTRPSLRPILIRLAWIVGGLAVVTGAASLLIGLNPGYTVALLVVVFGGALLLLRRRQGRATDPDAAVSFPSAALHVAGVGIATLVLCQAIPYGRSHQNPPVTNEPAWSSARTRQLTVNACYSCHSNETEWPWYANIAPISWAVSDHVNEGRDRLNFSEFNPSDREGRRIINVIRNGSMPPGYFTAFGRHPEANLTQAEIDELIAGLEATPGIGSSATGG